MLPQDFSVGFVYEEHLANVLCASFSPDGEFIASGDVKVGRSAAAGQRIAGSILSPAALAAA